MGTVTSLSVLFFFFFNDTATTEIYTLSLHDALPISRNARARARRSSSATTYAGVPNSRASVRDRKSTRLNSSHPSISYAVFCLKKKKKYTHSTNELTVHHSTITQEHTHTV